MTLEGKRALVTGSTSGIGRAIALRLAEAGAKVYLNSFDDLDRAVKTLDEFTERAFTCRWKEADISREEDVRALVEAVVAEWNGIDILVNNAGVSGAGTSFFDIGSDDWDRMLGINLKGSFLFAQAALPHMIRAGAGRIVNIASTAGISGALACNAHYSAAKGGIVALTRRLARDFTPFGITVNCIAPGLILDTGFNERMSPGKLESYLSSIPRGRPGYTRDVAGLAAFLASDEADYITGQVIAVDGGATC